MRGRSEHDPTMIRAWKRKPQPASSPRLLFELTTSIFYWKIQRFAPNLTFKPSPNTAPATKSDTWTSPSTHQVLHLPQKVTLELHQILRLPRKVTLELHQILRLSHKKTHILSPHHLWNFISNARSNRCPYPTSPNTAPVTKNDTARFKENLQKQVKRHFQCGDDPSMIRPWSEHENANRNPPRHRGYFSSSPRAFSIEKYNVSRPILHSNLHQILRLPRKVPLALHEVLRLPRKVTLELHQVLHLPRKVTLELHQKLRLPLYCNWTLLYSTLLYSTWHYSTWHYSTWHYSTWHYSTWHYSTWHYSTWLYSTWH